MVATIYSCYSASNANEDAATENRALRYHGVVHLECESYRVEAHVRICGLHREYWFCGDDSDLVHSEVDQHTWGLRKASSTS